MATHHQHLGGKRRRLTATAKATLTDALADELLFLVLDRVEEADPRALKSFALAYAVYTCHMTMRRHVACAHATSLDRVEEADPYAVYTCHMTAGSSKAYVVSIRRGAEPAIAMAAVCHFDTSNWNPNHMAFEALHTKPGGVPVCHFLPYTGVVFGAGA